MEVDSEWWKQLVLDAENRTIRSLPDSETTRSGGMGSSSFGGGTTSSFGGNTSFGGEIIHSPRLLQTIRTVVSVWVVTHRQDLVVGWVVTRLR